MKSIANFLAPLKRLLSARVLLTFGLVSLVVTALLGVSFIGAMPDTSVAKRDNRAAIAEALAATMMVSVADEKFSQAQAVMDFMVQRNPEIISVALRTKDKKIAVVSGPHEANWAARSDGKSTDTQLIVPLSGKSGTWGQTEIRFKPIAGNKIGFWEGEQRTQIILLVAVLCSFSFYFYLGRMLKQLDPSRAVPDRVRSALDTLSEGLLLLDNNGNVVLANQAFCALAGKQAARIVGQTVASFRWERSNGNPLAAQGSPWQLAMSTGKSQIGIPVWMNDAKGGRRSFLANCAPVVGENNKVGGLLLSLADVTELEEKEQQLKESKAQADAANRAKSDFLANMSHEIRTPMNAILGFTDLLRRGIHKGPDEAAKHLNTVYSSGRHLLGLINDILDLSKVEAGKLEVELLATSVHQVIYQVVETLQVRAQEKNIGLEFIILGKLPENIKTDAGRIRQIVTNLAGNAIKFTEKGKVKIVQRWDAQSSTMHIDVIDSGIGIAPSNIESIFQPFVQAEASTTRRFGGTGLGLSISQKFVQALGGTIKVTSEAGVGSQFSVSLPGNEPSSNQIDASDLSRMAKHNTATIAKSVRFARAPILVVDDSIENRELLKALLEPAGLIVDEAENGAIAIEKAKAKDYAVILMDMQMPVMDGFTATKALRAMGMKLPIIAFTAHALKGFESEINDAGCSGYLTKPVDLDLLNQTLAKHIRIEGLLRQSVSDVQLPASSTASKATLQTMVGSNSAVPPPATSPLISRLAAKPALHHVIDIFVERLPRQLEAMDEALAKQDLTALSQIAHWLKGSAGSVGFDMFTEPAKRLEEAAASNNLAELKTGLVEVAALSNRLQLATPHQSLKSTQSPNSTQLAEA